MTLPEGIPRYPSFCSCPNMISSVTGTACNCAFPTQITSLAARLLCRLCFSVPSGCPSFLVSSVILRILFFFICTSMLPAAKTPPVFSPYFLLSITQLFPAGKISFYSLFQSFCDLILVSFILKLFSFGMIGQKTTLGDHCHSGAFFQEIIAAVSFHTTRIRNLQLFIQTFLNRFRQAFSLVRPLKIKHLRSFYIRVTVTVLVYTDRKKRFCFPDSFRPP